MIPVIFRTDRYKRPLLSSYRILIGVNRQRLVELFSTHRDFLINTELRVKGMLPQNMILPGWKLFEMTLDNEEREKRFKKWQKLGFYNKNKFDLRNIEIEDYIFLVNSKTDEVFVKNIVYNVSAVTDFEKDMQHGVAEYRNRKYVAAARSFLNLLEKYPEEGMLYYYIANTFSYMPYGCEYSLRFLGKH